MANPFPTGGKASERLHDTLPTDSGTSDDYKECYRVAYKLVEHSPDRFRDLVRRQTIPASLQDSSKSFRCLPYCTMPSRARVLLLQNSVHDVSSELEHLLRGSHGPLPDRSAMNQAAHDAIHNFQRRRKLQFREEQREIAERQRRQRASSAI